MYDGATACTEAILMALRFCKEGKKTVLISGGLHPHYRDVARTYLNVCLYMFGTFTQSWNCSFLGTAGHPPPNATQRAMKTLSARLLRVLVLSLSKTPAFLATSLSAQLQILPVAT